MTRADSMRQIASYGPLMGVPGWPSSGNALFLRVAARRLELGRELGHLEDLAQFELGRTLAQGAALGPLDRLVLRLHIDQPVPPDHLLGLGKRAVLYDGCLAARELHPDRP